MSGPDVEMMQRWLQATLADLEDEPSGAQRDVRLRECEAAIQACIRFRTEWELRELADVSPTIEEKSAVRIVAAAPESDHQSGDACQNCEAPLTRDLDFCPSCGEFP